MKESAGVVSKMYDGFASIVVLASRQYVFLVASRKSHSRFLRLSYAHPTCTARKSYGLIGTCFDRAMIVPANCVARTTSVFLKYDARASSG